MRTEDSARTAISAERIHCFFSQGSQNSADFWEEYFLLAHWSHGLPIAAIAAVPPHATRTEAQVVRAAQAVRVERTRPAVAVAACVAEVAIVATACGGEEYTIAIALAGHFVTIHSILSCPGPSAIIDEFLLFFCGRHTPTTTPIRTSGIIAQVKGGFIIDSTITAAVIILG